MSRDWLLYVEDMRDRADRVLRYTAGMDRAAYDADERTQDAVLRNLEIVGEAAKNVPPDVRALYPDVDWRALAGFRDILAHAYFRIATEIVWDIVCNELPPLQQKVLAILAEHGRGKDPPTEDLIS